MHIDGGCHCGAIAYEGEVNPDNVIICHCTDCQTISGSPYRVSVPVLLSKFDLRGAPKTYGKTGDSGRKVEVAFCDTCGAGLYSQRAGADFVFLRVGSIRQRAELAPKRQGFCGSAVPWSMDISGVPRVPDPAPAP